MSYYYDHQDRYGDDSSQGQEQGWLQGMFDTFNSTGGCKCGRVAPQLCRLTRFDYILVIF